MQPEAEYPGTLCSDNEVADLWETFPPVQLEVDHQSDFFEMGVHDTWLGNGAQVRPEVTIGHGAVVAGGAIVTKDVAPYMIVAGIPAVPLRARFSAGIADRMMALAWWDWPHDALHRALDDFRALSAEAFLERYE